MSGALEAALRGRRERGGKCLVPYLTGGLGDDWINGTLDAIKAELRKREKEMNTTDNNETTASMPPKVAAAVSAVMSAVPKLAKTSKNSHGNYNFASIDDFLEAIRPLCAKNGLII